MNEQTVPTELKNDNRQYQSWIVANFLGIGLKQLRRRVQAGDIPARRVGHVLYFTGSEVFTYVNALPRAGEKRK